MPDTRSPTIVPTPPPVVVNVCTPDDIRRKLEKVLADKRSVTRSATVSFMQFDADASGSLDLPETKRLLDKLCENLQLPPIDEKTLQKVIARYDDGDGCLQLEEFVRLYWDLLLRIRDKYYPTKTMKVRREFFVGQRRRLESFQAFSEIFKIERKMGSGSFGEVHLVTEISSGMKRVCKTINKDRARMPAEQIEAEIEFLKSLDHPNIIKIFEVYEDYNNVYIIMELCEGGEMMQRIVDAQKIGRRMNERYVSHLMKQLMEALAYCHDNKVAHKDLKPENIMFSTKEHDSCLKVIDFGVAEVFKRCEEKSRNSAGTALYMAPEVYQRCFGVKCDVWSSGCIFFLLLTGRLPFMGTSVRELQKKVCSTEPRFAQDCRHLSPLAIDLLKKMLCKSPRQRPSSAEVLAHPWFQKAGENTITLSEDICGNLQHFMRQSGLKNVLVNLMAHQLDVSGSQIRQIINVFRALDKDNNGTITFDELTEGLQEAGWPQWDINRIMQALDIDDSSSIQYTEFLSACYSWRESELNVVWAVFKKLDEDGDGKITLAEFSKALAGGGCKLLNRDDMETMVKQIDKNGDGMVEWDEFVAFIRN